MPASRAAPAPPAHGATRGRFPSMAAACGRYGRQRGMSRDVLAERAGISASTVARLEQATPHQLPGPDPGPAGGRTGRGPQRHHPRLTAAQHPTPARARSAADAAGAGRFHPIREKKYQRHSRPGRISSATPHGKSVQRGALLIPSRDIADNTFG